jgi:hypothetical protein
MTVYVEKPRQINRRRPLPNTSVLLSGVSLMVVLYMIGTSDQMWHWFVLPTLVCGFLISRDAARWLDGVYDLFDPKGVIGILGWHFFFLAPLLFVYWNVGIRYVENPPDWRPWVGLLSLLNIAALTLYETAHNFGFRAKPGKQAIQWRISYDRALPWLMVFGVAALGAKLYQLQVLGGIPGVLTTTSTQRETGQAGAATGLGLYTMLGDALPIIAIIFLTLLRYSSRQRRSSFVTVMIILAVLALAQFILGGIQGSRSATIWGVFWMAGIVHFWWRPFSRRITLVAMVLLIIFMYLYGFYKGSSLLGGTQALQSLFAGESIDVLETRTGRNLPEMLVGDMSRSDTQSFELYRLVDIADYGLRGGGTYLGTFRSIIPSWIWSERPLDPEKIVAGTELFLGRGSYVPGNRFRNSLRVYGLGGEAMLNFGVLAYPVPFALWGFLMGRFRRAWFGWEQVDGRVFLVPLVTLLFLIGLIGDFDNLLGFFISRGVIIVVLLVIVCQRVRVTHD